MNIGTIKREIKREITRIEQKEQEHKYYDVAIPTGYAVAGTITALSNVPQGVAQSQRVGDELTQLALYLTAASNSAPVSSPGCINRMIIFEWFPNTVPIVANILTAALPTAEFQWQDNDNFEVLFDSLWNIASGISNCDCQVLPDFLQKPIPLRTTERKLRDGNVNYAKKQTFAPGAATGQNQLYILMIGTSASVTNVGQTRFHYLDA